MNDTVDLSLLSGSLQGVEREVRLLRLQLDQLAGTMPARIGGVEARMGVMEQSVHDLATETARGFGQIQQQLTRHEKRFDALDAGLAALRVELAKGTERLIQIHAILTGGQPTSSG